MAIRPRTEKLDQGSMGIISRYVFRQAASSLSLILASLGGIVWIALALKELNVVTSEGQDAIMLIEITSLALPNLIAVIAPFALLIAAMHTLNRLGGDSELIVLTASGSPVWLLARPLIALALIVSIGVAFVNHVAQPWSLQRLKSLIVEMRADLLTKVIQPGRFSSPEPNLTFHIRERDLNGDLRGLLVTDQRKKEENQTYLAERAVIAKQDGGAFIVMSDGHILRRKSLSEPAQIIVFDQYIADLDSFERQNAAGPIDFKPRERYFHQLVKPEASSAYYQRLKGQFRAELHERFSNPLYPIAFVLIALAAVGQAQSTRENRSERLVIGFTLAVAIRLVGFAANTLAAKSAAWTFSLYALPLAAIIGSIVSLKRGARPHRRISITDTLADRLSPLLARLPRWMRSTPAAADGG